MAANVAAALLVVFLVAPIAVYGETFNVDWTLNKDYSSWATKSVSVGDTMVFTYGSTHSVLVVSKDDYTNCATSNPTYTDSSGKTSYKFTKAGPVYFICGTPGHCPGMKLQVNVKAASTSSSGGSTTSTSPSPTTTTTPSSTPASTTSTSKSGAATHGLSWMAPGVSLVFGTMFAFMG